ncbi:hypothetical protein NQZ68_013253 [Dissostichus eleginoides]|nr:hypothetical protein NQZ68_013253 [Dissostichus eleginoides]
MSASVASSAKDTKARRLTAPRLHCRLAVHPTIASYCSLPHGRLPPLACVKLPVTFPVKLGNTELPMPGPVIQLGVKNLRSRQLSAFNIDSMSDSVLSLYHSLITGSKDDRL